MIEVIAEIGDIVWFYLGNHQGELSSGEVVHIFDRYGPKYVVEIATAIEPVYEVYDPFTISDAADKPIGMWRNLKS